MTSYLFYDIETTGLNPAFDQILQFAAIRTDMTLKETDRIQLNVRLRPDVIPSPGAVLTHGIGATESDSGSCEFEAITQIHRWINTPGTISLGYNSLNFDDVFLRFSFYRNLLPPYTHQYDKGCSRMDLFPMTIVFWLYRPEVIKWPAIGDKVSLTLENINTANDFADGRSHNNQIISLHVLTHSFSTSLIAAPEYFHPLNPPPIWLTGSRQPDAKWTERITWSDQNSV